MVASTSFVSCGESLATQQTTGRPWRSAIAMILLPFPRRVGPTAVALASEQPSPQTLPRLEHEYSLAAELDPAWAARPLALTRHEGRTVLVLSDPGGDPMDRILDRGQGHPLELTRCLRVAIGLATAAGQVHRHGLIHKDIKPA